MFFTNYKKPLAYIASFILLTQTFYPILQTPLNYPQQTHAQEAPSETPTPTDVPEPTAVLTPSIEPTTELTPTPTEEPLEILEKVVQQVEKVKEDKVRICHATASDVNPYNSIEVSPSAIDGEGGGDHNDDGHQNGDDIIPPGDWDESGRNWDTAGQAIYNNDCEIPEPSESPTPTPTDEPKDTTPLGEENVCREGTLFMIGDEEASQTDNPVDEMNWPGTFGVFPPFADPFVVDSADPDSSTFAWNSNYEKNEGREFDIDFEYAGTPATARVTMSWSPGKSGIEQKEVLFDGGSLGTTSNRAGVPVGGWWEDMEIVQDSFDFYLEPGEHTLTMKHLKGDGTLWDYVKVEIIECDNACEEGPTWAHDVVNAEQGLQKSGASVLSNRSDSSKVLGEDDNQFYSLGFGGVLTVMFEHAVSNVDGDDLSFHEVTNGTYPLETASVEVSQDGTNFYAIGEVNNQTNGGVNYLDFDTTGLSWIKYVRITDTTDAGIHASNADGYDIDAIDATYGLCSDPDPDPRNVCGNWEVEENEQCDDGNTNNGDGCSASCQWEASCIADLNMINNGDFEEPIVTNNKKWDIFDKTQLGGWNVEWVSTSPSSYGGFDRPAEALLELHRRVNNWNPFSGQQHAELDTDWAGPNDSLNGEPASTTIYQDIPTIPGEEYTVTFQFSPRPRTGNGNNQLGFYIDGSLIDTLGGSGSSNTVWTEYSHTFVATGTPTRVEFTDLGTPDSLGTFIDDVSVYCAPGTTIDGYKFNDRNANGEWDKDEKGLEGWEIVLKSQKQKPASSFELDSADADGVTSASLDAGKKYLVEVEGVWFNFRNNRRAVDADYFSDNSWSTVQDLDDDASRDPRQLDVVIDNQDVDWASYNDGHLYKTVVDGADAPITLRVFDQDNDNNFPSWYNDNDGSLQVRIYEVLESAVTDENGYYSFDVEPGEYQVVEVQQNGWTQTAPSGPSYCHITAETGSEYSCTFGNQFTPRTFDLRVCKKGDGDYNVQTTDDQYNVNGWSMTVYQDGDVLDTQKTEKDGCYLWTELDGQSKYTVVEETRDNWGALTATEHEVDPVLGQTYEHTFVNFEYGQIQGRKFNDENQNGSRQGGESRLNDWTIRLYNSDWELLGTQTTGHTGRAGQYKFSNLTPGIYYTCEVQQDGWTQTAPIVHENLSGELDEAPYCHRSNINGPGRLQRGRSFGNTQEQEPSVTPTSEPTETPQEEGQLFIQKSNNVFPVDVSPGNTVIYTIVITARGGSFLDVDVTDLPPGDFTYVPGSWTASSSLRGNLKTLGITTEPTYASPGDWNLGEMKDEEVVTLTYEAQVGGVDPGQYPDLAWAAGTRSDEETVLAQAETTGYVDTYFAGTDVTVRDTDGVSKSANLEKKDEDGDVLGATTDSGSAVLGASTLPATGANALWIFLASIIVAAGSLLLGLGFSIKKGFKLRNVRLLKILISAFIIAALLLGVNPQATYAAAEDLSVRIEEPASPTNEDDFSFNFVALDRLGRTMSATCMVKDPSAGSFTAFDSTKSLQAGGDDEFCTVDSSIMDEIGTYEFKVSVTAGGDTKESSTVSVDFSDKNPGTPKNYSKSGQGCGYRIKGRTDNDGITSRVEIYRSDLTEFKADDGSRVATINIGPNENFEYDDGIPDCGKKYYYVVRAFDDYNNGSGLVGDEVVVVISTGSTGTVVASNGTGGAVGSGAFAVQARDSQVGDENADNEDSEESQDSKDGIDASEEDGDVLGAEDEVSQNPVVGFFSNRAVQIGLAVLLLLIIIGYVINRRRN